VRGRGFERAAALIATLLVTAAGFVLWRSGGATAPPRVREQRVAWRCAEESGDAGTCSVASEVERCITCHEATSHPQADVLLARHAAIGCVACHGGDGLATERAAAHADLARLGRGDDVPEVQARCAACHADTAVRAEAPAKLAWARWIAEREGKPAPTAPTAPAETGELAPELARGRALFRSMRCGACHVARERSPIATPLAVLGLRSGVAELAAALRDHEKRASYDLGLDETGALAVATHLVASAPADASTAIVHRASVPGASAEDGAILYDKLACASCHDPSAKGEGRLRVDLAHVASSRSADWVAYFLAEPSRANPAATMPSLRLTAREAASLALKVVPHRVEGAAPASRGETVTCKIPGGETKPLARDACGEAIVSAAKCATCHAPKLSPTGPSLARFGESHDGAAAEAKLAAHAGFHFGVVEKRAVATYLVAQRDVRVLPESMPPPPVGVASFASRGCAGCHALDDVTVTTPGPSLFGEGLRTQPQWLFAFLRAPERHAVRPSLHPEWAFRDLVPPDRVAPRMPTYALDERETSDLVAMFSERDGASLPYAAVPRVSLAGDALANALADFERKDRGACTSCHTIGQPDATRARDEAAKLAPPLALAHERLRPAWIDACILQPGDWVHGMPAFVRPMDEIERVRDLVLLLRARTVLPPPGEESSVPALGLGDLP